MFYLLVGYMFIFMSSGYYLDVGVVEKIVFLCVIFVFVIMFLFVSFLLFKYGLIWWEYIVWCFISLIMMMILDFDGFC